VIVLFAVIVIVPTDTVVSNSRVCLQESFVNLDRLDLIIVIVRLDAFIAKYIQVVRFNLDIFNFVPITVLFCSTNQRQYMSRSKSRTGMESKGHVEYSGDSCGKQGRSGEHHGELHRIVNVVLGRTVV
jgi:hypothetical protein